MGLPLVDKLPALVQDVEPLLAETESMKVVLVEDNSDAREMLKLLLEMDGFQVVAAGDGRRGLDAILSEQPGVAIVDIGLPELDGFAVAREVRASKVNHDVYLIALTGYGQAQDRVAVTEAGFDEHLVKPVDPNELARVVSIRAITR